MLTTIEQFEKWINKKEDLNLEFKSAKNQFDESRDLPDYCAALSNEGGGKLILGVAPDGSVIGTKAFSETHTKLSHKLLHKIKIRVDVEDLAHPKGRVLIFHIPPRPKGQIVKSTGNHAFPMRSGDSLTEMDQSTIRKIFQEVDPDFSNLVIPNSNILDFVDPDALKILRQLRSRKANRSDLFHHTDEQFLRDLGLLTDKGINYACLILLGKKAKIDELLPDAEIIFEWRQSPQNTNYDFRCSWREPFLKVHDEIWKTVNARNIRIPFQEGLIQWEIDAFDQKSVREAVLNGVTHRDYTTKGRSVFIKASSESLIVESPGGFLPGITPENVINKSLWRNRRLAETLEKEGLVERSGQGMDDIFQKTIQDGKGFPDLSLSDEFSVILEIPAKVKDPQFIMFLQKISKEKEAPLSFYDVFELEKIRQFKESKNTERRTHLFEMGIIEKIGRGRGTKYILSHNYYVSTGKAGAHTRLRGLSREQKKQLILNHFEKNKKGLFADFKDAFPELKPMDISNLLRELKQEGKIEHVGSKRTGYWVLKS